MIKQALWLIYSQTETDRNDGEQMFWSNDIGWVDFTDATLFEAYPAGYLPMQTTGLKMAVRVGDRVSLVQ